MSNMEKLPTIITLEDNICSDHEEIFETNEDDDGSDVVVLSDSSECNEDCSELLCDNMLKEDFDNFVSDEVISDDYLSKENEKVNSASNCKSSSSCLISDSTLERSCSNPQLEDLSNLCDDKLGNSNDDSVKNIERVDVSVTECNFNCNSQNSSQKNELFQKSNFVNSMKKSMIRDSVNSNMHEEKIIEHKDSVKTVCVDISVTEASVSIVPVDSFKNNNTSANASLDATLTLSSNSDSIFKNNMSDTYVSSKSNSLKDKVLQDSSIIDSSSVTKEMNSEILKESSTTCPLDLKNNKMNSLTVIKKCNTGSTTELEINTEDSKAKTKNSIKEPETILGEINIIPETEMDSNPAIDPEFGLERIEAYAITDSENNMKCSETVYGNNTVCSKTESKNIICTKSDLDQTSNNEIEYLENATSSKFINSRLKSRVNSETKWEDEVCLKTVLERDKEYIDTVLESSSTDSETVVEKSTTDSETAVGKSTADSETVVGKITGDSETVVGKSIADSETVVGSTADFEIVVEKSTADSETVVGKNIVDSETVMVLKNIADSETVVGKSTADSDTVVGKSTADSDTVVGKSTADSEIAVEKSPTDSEFVLKNSSMDVKSLLEKSTIDVGTVVEDRILGSEFMDYSRAEKSVVGDCKFSNERKLLKTTSNSKKIRTKNKNDQSEIIKHHTRNNEIKVKNKYKITVIFVDKVREIIEKIKEPVKTFNDECTVQDDSHNSRITVNELDKGNIEVEVKLSKIPEELLNLNEKAFHSSNETKLKSEEKVSIKNGLSKDAIIPYSLSNLNKCSTDPINTEQLMLQKFNKVNKVKKYVEKVKGKRILVKPSLNNKKKKVIYVEKQRLLRSREKVLVKESSTNSTLGFEDTSMKSSLPAYDEIDSTKPLFMKSEMANLSENDEGMKFNSEKEKVLYREKDIINNILGIDQDSVCSSQKTDQISDNITSTCNGNDSLQSFSTDKISKLENLKVLTNTDSNSMDDIVKKPKNINFENKNSLENMNLENKKDSNRINFEHKKISKSTKLIYKSKRKIMNPKKNEPKSMSSEVKNESSEKVSVILPEVVQSMYLKDDLNVINSNSGIENSSDHLNDTIYLEKELEQEGTSSILNEENICNDKTTTTDSEDLSNQRMKRKSLKFNINLKEEVQQKCCGHWFPNKKSFIRHLIENAKNEMDSLHAAKLIYLDMQKCSICSLWLNIINIKKHNKVHHNVSESIASNDSSISDLHDKSVENKSTENNISLPQASKLIDTGQEHLGRVQKPCPKSKKIYYSGDILEPIKCYLNFKNSNALEPLVIMPSLNDLPHYLKPSIILRRCKIKLKKKICRKKKLLTPRYIDLLNEGSEIILKPMKKKIKSKLSANLYGKEESIPKPKKKKIKSILATNDKEEIMPSEQKEIKLDTANSNISDVIETIDENSTSNAVLNSDENLLERNRNNTKKTETGRINKVLGKINKGTNKLIKKRAKSKIIAISKPISELETNSIIDKIPNISVETSTVKCKEPLKTRRLSIESVQKSLKFKNLRNTVEDIYEKKIEKLKFRRPRKRGRPRKRYGFGSDSSDESSDLSDSSSNFENDEILSSEEFKESDEFIPTVELNLFTLSSINEDVSVLLVDPKNPNFKVMASMDAIFVGDSALSDVTNHMGYVSYDYNVVYISPNHFLFPEINDSEDVPLLQRRNTARRGRKRNILVKNNMKPFKMNEEVENFAGNNNDKENSYCNKPIDKKYICNNLIDKENTCNKLIDKENTCSNKSIDKENTCSNKLVDKENTCSNKPVDKENICSNKPVDKENTCSNKVIYKESTCDNKPIDKKNTCSIKPIDKENTCSNKPIDKANTCTNKSIDKKKILYKGLNNENQDFSNQKIKLNVSEEISLPIKFSVSKEIPLPINFSVDSQKEIEEEASHITDKDITSKTKTIKVKKADASHYNPNKTLKIVNKKSTSVEQVLNPELILHSEAQENIENDKIGNLISNRDSKVIVIKTSTRNDVKKFNLLESNIKNNKALVTISTNRKNTLVNGLPLDAARNAKNEQKSGPIFPMASVVSDKDDLENLSYKVLADSKNPIIPKNFQFPALHSVDIANDNNSTMKNVFNSKDRRSAEQEAPIKNKASSQNVNHSNNIISPCKDPGIIAKQCFSPVKISTDTQVVVATAKILPSVEEIEDGICLEEMIEDSNCLLAPSNDAQNINKSIENVSKFPMNWEETENSLLNLLDCNLDIPDILESALLSSTIIPDKSKDNLFSDQQSDIGCIETNEKLSQSNVGVNQASKSINLEETLFSPSKSDDFFSSKLNYNCSLSQANSKSPVKEPEVFEISSESDNTSDSFDVEVNADRSTSSVSPYKSPFDFKAVVQGHSLWNTPLICLSNNSISPDRNHVSTKLDEKVDDIKCELVDKTANLSSINEEDLRWLPNSKKQLEVDVSESFIKEPILSSNKKLKSPSKSHKIPVSETSSDFTESKAQSKFKYSKKLELKIPLKSPKSMSKTYSKSPKSLAKLLSKVSKDKAKTPLKSPKSLKKSPLKSLNKTPPNFIKSLTKKSLKSPTSKRSPKKLYKPIKVRELNPMNVDDDIFKTPEKNSPKNKSNVGSPKNRKKSKSNKNLLNKESKEADLPNDSNLSYSIKNTATTHTPSKHNSVEISVEKSSPKKLVTPSVVSRSSDSLKMRICVKDFNQELLVNKDHVHKHKKKKKHSKKKRERKLERQKMSELLADGEIKTKNALEDSSYIVENVATTVKVEVPDNDYAAEECQKENEEISNVAQEISENIVDLTDKKASSSISTPLVVKHFDSVVVPLSSIPVDSSSDQSKIDKTFNQPEEMLKSIKVENKELKNSNESSPSKVNCKLPSSTSSPKSPSVDDRSWHSRGSKLKAKVMITDQQKGITNSFVGHELKSPTSPLLSPSTSKSYKRRSDSIKTKDIRNYFTPSKPSDEKPALQSLNISPVNKMTSPSSNLPSPPFVSPDLLHNGPSKSKPSSGISRIPKKSKRKLPQLPQNMDIRQFFSGSKPTSESMNAEPNSKKVRLDVKIEVEEPDFEGFENDSDNYSGNRSKILQEYVDVLHTNTWFDSNRFPFPIDQLCDWDDDQLNVALFEKG